MSAPRAQLPSSDGRILWAGGYDLVFSQVRHLWGVLEIDLHCYCLDSGDCVQECGPFLWALGPQMCQYLGLGVNCAEPGSR